MEPPQSICHIRGIRFLSYVWLLNKSRPGFTATLLHCVCSVDAKGNQRSMQKAVRDSATAQAQAEATKATQRAGIEHAKANDGRAYLGRKPSSV